MGSLPYGSIQCPTVAMQSLGRWRAFLSEAVHPGRYSTTCRTPIGRPTVRAWRWSATCPKAIIGGWSIPSARCCWMASTGSAPPRFHRMGNGLHSPTMRIREEMTKAALPSLIRRGTKRNFRRDGVRWRACCGLLRDEVWFSASDSGSADNLRGVTLSGKLRTITNVPGGMWLQDIRNGVALMLAQNLRVEIRGMAPGGKEEKELGWLGWSQLRDVSRDGRKVLFEEEADGGGPNYTVYLRDMDGSPPIRIGEGRGEAISPDNKWVVTQPAKGGGALSVVPTGAGEARQLTHDH